MKGAGVQAADGLGESHVVAIHQAAALIDCRLPFFLCTVPAGFPSPAEEYLQGKLDLNEHLIRHPAATFYVRAAGVSMERAGILSGDVLVVDRAEHAVSGDIVVAVVSGELLVKRLKKARDGVWLTAEAHDPDAFPPLRLAEGADFQVWGVVTGVVRLTRERRGNGRLRPG